MAASGPEAWLNKRMVAFLLKGGVMRLAQMVLAFVAGFFMCLTLNAHLDMDHEAPTPAAKLAAAQQFKLRGATGAPAAIIDSALPQAVSTGPIPAWQYWDYCGGTSPCPQLSRYGGVTMPEAERFLLADTRGAGWNNDRQSLELAYAMAFVWRRTLVLPEWMGNPCDPSILQHVNLSFDVQAMTTGVKVMSATEFVAYARENPTRFPGGASAIANLGIYPKDHWLKTVGKRGWREVTGWFYGLEGVAERLFKNIPEIVPFVTIGAALTAAELTKVKDSWEFKRFSSSERPSKGALALSQEESDATALYIGPRKLLGNFYSMIYVPDPMIAYQLRNTMRRALHIRPEFFSAAAAAMDAGGIRPAEYGALHNRLGDFQQAYKQYYLDPKDPKKWLSDPQNLQFVRQNGKIYMAVITSPGQAWALENVFLPRLREEMPEPKMLITLSDKVKEVAKARVGHLKGWQGIIEMIICAQAGIFIGSWASTFSGYIHRLRGYMPGVADKRQLWTDSSKSDRRAYPSWSAGFNAGQISWMREWPEGY